MVDVLQTHVFYPKIIDDKCEGDGAGDVLTKAGCLFALKISVGGQAFAEQFVG